MMINDVSVMYRVHATRLSAF